MGYEVVGYVNYVGFEGDVLCDGVGNVVEWDFM